MVNLPIVSDNITQFSYGFLLVLPFEDARLDKSTPVSDGDETWEVVVVKPDGTGFTRDTGDGVAFPDDDNAKIGVPISALDLDQKGEYSYQVIRTTDGGRIRAAVGTFTTEASLPLSLPLAPPDSPLENYFPIFNAQGVLTPSLMYVSAGIIYLDGIPIAGQTAASIGDIIAGASAKATPVDVDLLAVADSADGFDVKKTTWAQIKSALLGYFNTKYLQLTLADAKGDIFVATADNTIVRLPIGADGKVLTSDSGVTEGMKWSTPADTGGDGVWGAITGDLADQTDLVAEFANKVTKNSAITGATKTKVTYDAKGLVTGGADATPDDLAEGTTFKKYSATEQSKLAGIASGATANDSDANLKSRANHTGTQLASTISDFSSAVAGVAPNETTTTIGSLINGATAKTSAADADMVPLMDSAASNVVKKWSFSNIKANIQSAFSSVFQGLNADLTAISGLSPSNDQVLQRKAGAWTVRTPGQLKTDLGLTKADVALSSVDDVQQLPLSYLDTDSALAADSDSKVASQKAIKAYVDARAAGFAFKLPVRAVSTSNITLSGAQTIDGVSIVAGNRVLVAGQSTAANNGIYVAASGSWSRATDADTSAELPSGMYTYVTEGTTYGDTGWSLITDGTITLGSTSLTFGQTTGAGAITAGEGLTKTGSVLDVNVDSSTIEINTDILRVKDGGISLAKMANMATGSLIYRKTAGTGAPEVQSLATLKSDLGLTGTNSGDETTTTLGTLINGATAKTTPVDTDYLPLMDSAASNVVKKLSWSNVKATAKTYFDTIYQPLSAVLTAFAGLTVVADKLPYFNGTGTMATTDFTSVARTLVNQTTQSAMRSTGLGLGSIATLSAPSGSVVGTTDTQTLTNKTLIDSTNVIEEKTTTTTSSTPTPTGGSVRNSMTITALAANATFGAPSGTPVDGNMLLVRYKDNGSPRTLAYNAIYRAFGVTLKTTTVANKTGYFLARYNSADSKWDVLLVSEEA